MEVNHHGRICIKWVLDWDVYRSVRVLSSRTFSSIDEKLMARYYFKDHFRQNIGVVIFLHDWYADLFDFATMQIAYEHYIFYLCYLKGLRISVLAPTLNISLTITLKFSVISWEILSTGCWVPIFSALASWRIYFSDTWRIIPLTYSM